MLFNPNINIYLDNQATTPLSEEVKQAIVGTLDLFGNPSSMHLAGQKAKAALTLARRELANHLQVDPSQIIFTSGGTEAIQTLIWGILKTFPKKKRILSSTTEHVAVIETLKQAEKEGWTVDLATPHQRGVPSLQEIEALICPETCLIVLMAANNETGCRLDIDAIAHLAAQHHIPLIIDAIALWGKEPLKLPKSIAGFALSGHKIHAPKGIGIAVVGHHVKLQPLLLGGHQEGGRRAGTENLIGALAIAAAATAINSASFTYQRSLRDLFERRIFEALSCAYMNGQTERTSAVSNLFFEGVDGESLLMHLDLKGVMASHGSACSSGARSPSRVLLAMGYPQKRAHASLRFSFSRLNTPEEAEHAASIVIEAVRALS